MSETLGVQKAWRDLPELLSRAEVGEQLVNNRHGQPVAALVPLDQRQVPQRRLRLGLRGSGRRYWPQALGSSRTTQRARQVSPAAAATSGRPFDPHRLPQGALIGFKAWALIAFLSGAVEAGGLLARLLEGIAQGYWRGQISSLCLIRRLERPLSHGHEERVQSYRRCSPTPSPGGWWRRMAPSPRPPSACAGRSHAGPSHPGAVSAPWPLWSWRRPSRPEQQCW